MKLSRATPSKAGLHECAGPECHVLVGANRKWCPVCGVEVFQARQRVIQRELQRKLRAARRKG